MQKKYIVGLTGGIACGKTTVSRHFENLGILVVDADIIARQVVEVGSPLLATLAQTFGSDIIADDGSLKRQRLREIIFADKALLAKLNSLMHPAIHQAMIEQAQRGTSDYVIMSIPLLFENKLEAMVDRILVVDVPYEIQLERTLKRDHCTLETAKSMLAAQVSREYRLMHADDIIHGEQCSLAQIKEHVIELDLIYKELACTQS